MTEPLIPGGSVGKFWSVRLFGHHGRELSAARVAVNFCLLYLDEDVGIELLRLLWPCQWSGFRTILGEKIIRIYPHPLS
jgi:hypothetical protein